MEDLGVGIAPQNDFSLLGLGLKQILGTQTVVAAAQLARDIASFLGLLGRGKGLRAIFAHVVLTVRRMVDL